MKSKGCWENDQNRTLDKVLRWWNSAFSSLQTKRFSFQANLWHTAVAVIMPWTRFPSSGPGKHEWNKREHEARQATPEHVWGGPKGAVNVKNPTNIPELEWFSMRISFLTSFIIFVCFGLYVSTFWTFVKLKWSFRSHFCRNLEDSQQCHASLELLQHCTFLNAHASY